MLYLLVYDGLYSRVDFFTLSLPLRATPRVDFSGAQLLVIALLHQRHLPFTKVSVPT